MSFWDRFRRNTENVSEDSLRYAVVDAEVGLKDHKVHDIGALRFDDAMYHQASKDELIRFLRGVDFVCGHNIVHHDSQYLFDGAKIPWTLVDTLYVSPLLPTCN